MAEIDAYDKALESGQYQKPDGLRGKYDNVRRFWEDEELGLYLRPYLERLVARKKERGERLRIMDLGCGSGDGLEFITSISSKSLISEPARKVIGPDMLELYQGIELNGSSDKQHSFWERCRGIAVLDTVLRSDESDDDPPPPSPQEDGVVVYDPLLTDAPFVA